MRYQSALLAWSREIAILLVAHHWGSAYETYAHEAVGRSIGLSDPEISAIRRGAPEFLDDPHERLVAETVTLLLTSRDLDDEHFDAARRGLGLPVVFELSTLVGYYATLALQLRVFRVGVPH